MLVRILPIIAFLAMGVAGYLLWSSGTLTRIMQTTVSVPVANRMIVEGQTIQPQLISIRQVPVGDIEPGMMSFPPEATKKEIADAFGSRQVRRALKGGEMITEEAFTSGDELVVFRSSDDIAAGESISLLNVRAVRLSKDMAPGMIVFESATAALTYLNDTFDLSARVSIPSGQVLTISDTAGGADLIYVIRASRGFQRAEQLSIDGLDPVEISSRELPRGAIAFPTREAADIFITTAQRYVAASALDNGEFITADTVASDGGLRALPAGDLPRTFSELEAFRNAYPDEVLLVRKSMFIDGEPDAGQVLDIWVEESRTGGAFGEIRLERLSQDAQVNVVYSSRTEADEAEQAEEDGVEAPRSDSLVYHWVQLDPEVTRAFEKARARKRIAFVAASNARLVDQLGNGAACLPGRCQVNRAASGDLEAVLPYLTAASEVGVDADLVEGAERFLLLDGVSPQLANRLVENGNRTFEDVASWTDEDITAMSFSLNISTNLALYLREQSEIMVRTPENARQKLGFEEAPEN